MSTIYDRNVDNGSPPTINPGGLLDLNFGDALELKIGSGFEGTWFVVQVDFYNVSNGGKGTNHLGYWRRSPATSNLPTGLTSEQTGLGVQLIDTAEGSDQNYYYTATVTNGTDRKTTEDPELTIRRKSGT